MNTSLPKHTRNASHTCDPPPELPPHNTTASPFIPSWLDDADLRPAEFRLLCRIYRRGQECFESVPSIAAGCRLEAKTVRRIMQQLLARSIIKRKDRPGRSALLSVTEHQHWQVEPLPNGTRGAKRVHPNGTPTPLPNGTRRRESPKVTPLKCPHSLVETIYEAYPRKVGKPAALRAITAALRRGIEGEDLLAITQRFGKAWDGETDLQFCPHPATWFNQERYADAPDSWRNGRTRATTEEEHARGF